MFQKVFQNSILFCINHSNIQRPHLFSDLHSRKLAILLDYECSIAYLYIHSHTPDQLLLHIRSVGMDLWSSNNTFVVNLANF